MRPGGFIAGKREYLPLLTQNGHKRSRPSGYIHLSHDGVTSGIENAAVSRLYSKGVKPDGGPGWLRIMLSGVIFLDRSWRE